MPYEATVYNVFIASPSDVLPERDFARQVIYEWNAVHAEAERAILQPIGWETHSFPDMGDRAQGIINRQILAKSDILVAIFWYRLGTATGVAESGTIEEIENHLKSGRPAMIYFSSKDVPRNIDTGQLEAIRRAEKNYQDRGLIDTFENPDGFRQKFTRHLAARMVEYLKSQPPHSRSESNLVPSDASVLARLDPPIAFDAVRLLQEATKSSSREIHRKNIYRGFQIVANQKNFINDGERKTEARWKAALDELVSKQFVEPLGTSGQIYQVTHAGDMFLKDLSKEVLAKFADNDEVFVNVELIEHGLELKRSDYVVRVPRAAAEEADIEWNMRYLFNDQKFEQLVFSAAYSDENYTMGRSWKVNISPFLGDSDSLPEDFEQTPNNCRIWKI
jgi:hypothetical protein